MAIMKSQNNKHDIQDESKKISTEGGLPILILPEFTDLQNHGNYYTSFKKIGDSVVYVKSRGNLKNFDLDKFIADNDAFCKVAGIKKPYVQIYDLATVSGRLHFGTLKNQMRFFYENQDALSGLVIIDVPSWVKPFINQGLRLLKPNFRFVSAINYADAVNAAQQILDGSIQHRPDWTFKSTHKALSFKDLLFNDEWEYNNAKTGFRYKLGCIPGYLLYASIHGSTKEAGDILSAGSLLEKVMLENRLSGIPFMIADYSETEHNSIHIRQLYAKEVKRITSKTQNMDVVQFIVNASRLNKIAIKLFATFVKRQFLFVDSVDEAFDIINDFGIGLHTDGTSKGVFVSANDLEELSNVFGILQWDDTGTIPEIQVSVDNPLNYLTESLELIKNDLNEMRANERRIHDERLLETEINHRKLLRMMQDTEAAQAALTKAEESKRILLDNIKTQIWYLTDATTYGAVNKAHADFKGMKMEDIAFKSFYGLYPEDVVNDWKHSNSKVFNSKKPTYSEKMLYDASGGKRLIAITKTPKLCKEGKVEYVVCTAEDITERKQAEEQIKLQNRQLHELNAQKDKFFSIIAHDLRSPFNAILGFSELLVNQIKNNDFKSIDEYAGIIQQSAQRALNLLINLLDWSRAQTGRTEFNPEFFEIVGLIRETLPILKDSAVQKNITIKEDLPHSLPVFADKPMISTILRNLISNAIKYSNHGGEIIITAKKKNNETLVSVSDNGVGIAADKIDKLFNIDQAESTPGTDNEKGTGLGLILCKEFIDKHDGKIWAASEDGKGSTMFFTIPLKIAS